MLIPIGNIYGFIVAMTRKYGIDETHGVRHSMNVYEYSQKIFAKEVKKVPMLIDQERLIYTSALLHDLCDHKYIDEREGKKEIGNFLMTQSYQEKEIKEISKIISTMSYSKIKVSGVPNHGDIQKAFQIVRESDLLDSYDVDRCILYDMLKKDTRFEKSYENAKLIFDERMFKYLDDYHIVTEEGRKLAENLEIQSKNRIEEIKKSISNNYTK
tara:strand:+ start:500 stop:1138 length:639 start_codon:yes stop_codon:yes gene_type:complete